MKTFVANAASEYVKATGVQLLECYRGALELRLTMVLNKMMEAGAEIEDVPQIIIDEIQKFSEEHIKALNDIAQLSTANDILENRK